MLRGILQQIRLYIKRVDSPFVDKSEGRYLNDLLGIGPAKPLGYLPLDTIRNCCQVDLTALTKYLKKRGLETREGDSSFCNVAGGALYAYDQDSLQKLLDRNSAVLAEADWPMQADDFVVMMATTTAEPKLHHLVADAFADFKNRYL